MGLNLQPLTQTRPHGWVNHKGPKSTSQRNQRRVKPQGLVNFLPPLYQLGHQNRGLCIYARHPSPSQWICCSQDTPSALQGSRELPVAQINQFPAVTVQGTVFPFSGP